MAILLAALLAVGIQLPRMSHASAATSVTFVVNSTGDAVDAVSDGICATSTNVCTLRAALREAQQATVPVTINFNIPGSGPQAILIASSLPTLSKADAPVTIDGYTQPGSSPNTSPTVSNAVLRVEIRGPGENTFAGISITSANNIVRGLSMTRLYHKVYITGADAVNNTVSGMWIGTDPTATYKATTRVTYANGIELDKGAASNIIGGHGIADRNVVSGNAGHGIATYNPGTNFNQILNNIVGLNPSATAAMANQVEGIDVNRTSSYNVIGGFGPFDHNLVGGNATGGIELSHNADTFGNQILGNYVGTDATGNTEPAFARQAGEGIHVEDGSSYSIVDGNVVGGSPSGISLETNYGLQNIVRNNRVGISLNGTAIPNQWGIRIANNVTYTLVQNNIIANNTSGGIEDVDIGNKFETFTHNSIYNNGGLGIDLNPIGSVNANDVGDADSGANYQLNFPEGLVATTLKVTGTACASCTVEAFIADKAVGQFGSGKTFVGTGTASSAGAFTAFVSGVAVGNVITTTATDPQGDTSEFSQDVAATQAPNNPPITSFVASCQQLACSFDGSASHDLDGTIASYSWNFGDGSPAATGAVVTHNFSEGGTKTVTLSATDNLGAVGSNTSSMVLDMSLPSAIASDTFPRTTTGTFGSADVGGAYSYPTGQAVNFSVGGGVGNIVVPTLGASRQATLAGVSAHNVDVEATITDNLMPTGSFGQTFVLQARRVAANTEYRARARFASNGQVWLSAAKATGTNTDVLIGAEVAAPGVTFVPGTQYRLKATVVGTSPATISVKLWKVGDPEPTGWTVVRTDSEAALQSGGGVGMQAYVSSSSAVPVNFSVDDFMARGPNNPPTAQIGLGACDTLTCAFDGSNSTDSDGTVAAYTWSFSDGGTATGATPSHTFPSAGTYTATLTVTDNNGGMSSTSISVAVPNAPPVPSFTSACSNLSCSFDGTNSTDPDGSIVGYQWNFGDSTVATGSTAPHGYAGGGTYDVTLTVTDNRGAVRSIVQPVTVTAPDVPPVAAFTSSCTGLTCSFDAGTSSDSDGTIVEYSWDFGSGAADGTVTMTNTFPSAGTYPVTLTVTDNGGASDTITNNVIPPSPNVPPTASFTVTCTDLSCSFDGSASADSDGTIAAYDWDFGDGSVHGTGVSPAHVFSAGNTYPVTLTLTDNQGATGAETTNVVVTAPNQPPTAAFTVSCTGLVCSFDATASADSDGTIAGYSWDFADGATDTGETVQHTYATSGTRSVTLTVTDNLGATGAVANDATPAPPNVPPTASFTATCTELVCSFDATASADSDGTIAGYAWNFGDGATGTGITTPHTFTTAGPHTVGLTVTDNQGAGSAPVSQTVNLVSTIVSDTFTRTVSPDWGNADTGGAYTHPAGQAPNFSVAGGVGVIVVPAAAQSRQSWLASVSARDVHAEATVTTNVMPAGSFGETFILQTRRVAANTEYRTRVRFAADGSVHLATAKATGVNTEILIGPEITVPGLTFSPGTQFRLATEATGASPTTLRAMVWKVGTAQPATWQITTTDSEASLQTAGSVGMHAYLNATNTAPVTFTVDDYAVRRIGAV